MALTVELPGIDEVLPEDVAAGAYGGYGVEVGVGDPDGEGGVFLAEGLSGVDGVAAGVAYGFAEGELKDAQKE